MNELTIGYEYPRTKANHGRIYLNQQHLANFWTNPPDWAGGENKLSFNRDLLAFELKIPEAPYFDTLEQMIHWIKKPASKMKEDYEHETIVAILTRNNTRLNVLSDEQLRFLYREWSKKSGCAGWLHCSKETIDQFIKWATTAPCDWPLK